MIMVEYLKIQVIDLVSKMVTKQLQPPKDEGQNIQTTEWTSHKPKQMTNYLPPLSLEHSDA